MWFPELLRKYLHILWHTQILHSFEKPFSNYSAFTSTFYSSFYCIAYIEKIKNLLCFSNCADYASSVNVRFLQFKIHDFSNLCFPLSSTNAANFITYSALLFENGINKIYWNVVMGTPIGMLLCTRVYFILCVLLRFSRKFVFPERRNNINENSIVSGLCCTRNVALRCTFLHPTTDIITNS